MDERPQKQAKILKSTSEEVSSIEWEFIKMTEQEEDLVYRIYRLVGDRLASITCIDVVLFVSVALLGCLRERKRS
ncbi:PREDICTED: transcription factor TRY isoform X2 [Theobroma cacao]|uniref:Transcription factor TRY isoform X2 n=1 Tax=Theobroma cacao TaxID=3641 RepID=A0AB32VYW5_THECC|nr:PREDICTED: transcription factor TRY isoform X2 [Theobroma cacao]